MAASRPFTLRAFAKINLDLRVLGVRPDGYHELRTTFQSIALHDRLTFGRARGPFRIDCDEPDCPTDRRNLAWRAADLVWKAAGHSGRPAGAFIRIEKRIPMQAGLGGGSSDGAAALRGFDALWGARLTRERLGTMAAALGADVPYFLEGGTVLGLDRGDRLFPLMDAPPSWVVLLIPNFGVNTKDAFGWWDGAARERIRDRGPCNDLQPSVARRHPEITKLVNQLRRQGATLAAMSGSGSAVFGLFERRPDAEEAAAALAGRNRRSFLTRTLNRRESQTLAAK